MSTRSQRRWGQAAFITVLSVTALTSTTSQSFTIPNNERAVAHALGRLAFGADPAMVERVRAGGLGAWIDQQLRPERIADDRLQARLARLSTLTMEPRQIGVEIVGPARRERQRRLAAAAMEPPAPAATGSPNQAEREPGLPREMMMRQRQVIAELAEAKILRAVYSERQLEEVLVDFWFNHFNVFARKGQTEIYISEYEREAIRPHVLGSFRDLLGATAKSPAMLFYLDNWLSADPDASRRRADRPRLRPGVTPPPGAQNRRSQGLNENYARELLELHTLGVDGGYTQQDVVDVARAFTGWTIDRPAQAGFRFVPMMHDRGTKHVLGHTIAAGGGIEDGERVLDLLAGHKSTAKHISFKLTERFVSDTPPPALVDRAARVFETTSGNLREVVRMIVTSPEFFAPNTYRTKVKTPFEFVVSAVRATGVELQTALPLVRTLGDLGMPLYLCQPPTGYDETAATWVSSGALVNRMNFALSLAGGQLRGVTLPKEANGNVPAVRDWILKRALGDDASETTLATIAKATTAEQAIALTIGSPEFQRQ